MRLESLHIDGFGHFRDHEITELSPGLTVFLGENEAGKSTLLAFIRNILFGFPDGRSKENPYPPLAGGRHGGRLKVVDRWGARYTVERYQGKGLGPVRVSSENGAPAGENQLQGLLGLAGRGLFHNVFAFSLNELQQFATLEDDKVKSALYSAGLGSAVANLPEVEKALDQEAGSLFRSGGSKPRINVLLTTLESVKEELRSLPDDPEKYHRLCQDLDDQLRRSQEVAEALAGWELELRWIERLEQAWPTWVAFREVDHRLAQLSEPRPFPEDGLRRFEDLARDKRDLQAKLQVANERWEKLQRRFDSYEVDSRLLEMGERILRLAGRRSEWEQLRQELPAALRLEAELEAQLQRELRDLGSEWSAERLQRVDTSQSTRNRILAHLEALDQASQQLALAQQREEEARHRAEIARTAHQVRLQEAEGTPPPDASLAAVDPKALTEALGLWRTAVEHQRNAEREAQQAQQSVNEAMARLGSDWDEARVARVRPDREAIEFVRSFRARSEELEKRHRDQETVGVGLEERRAEKAERLAGIQQELDQLPTDLPGPEQGDTRSESLGTARRELRKKSELQARRERAQDRVNAESSSGSLPLWLVLLPLASGLALGALLLQRKMEAVGLAVALVLGLVSLSLWWWNRSREESFQRAEQARGEAQRELDSLNQELEECARRLQDLGGALGLSCSPSVEDLDRLQVELEGLARHRHTQQILTAEQKRVQVELERLQQKHEEVRSQLQQCRQQGEALRQEWKDWLASRGLPETPSPEATRDLLEEIRQVVDLLARREKATRHSEERRGRVAELAKPLRQALLGAGRSWDDDRGEHLLLRILDERGQYDESLRRFQALQKALEESKRECSEAERTLKLREQECAQSTAVRQTAWESWRADQACRSLQADSPKEAIRLLDGAKVARQRLDALGEKRAARRSLEERQEALLAEARELSGSLGYGTPGPEDFTSTLDRLVLAQRATEKAASDRERLRGQLEEWEREDDAPKVLEGQLHSVVAEIAALFQGAQVSEEEAFREAARDAAQRIAWQTERKSLQQTLRASSGTHSWEEFVERLATLDPDQLALTKERLQHSIHEKKQEGDECLEQRGRIGEQLKGVESSDRRARLRQREVALQETIQIEARKWGVLQLGVRLLKEARTRYERERQPEVIQRAQEHFGAMTLGRYPRLVAPPGGESILVERPDGVRLETTALSRGTAEQLYLALRLGFVQEFSQRSEPLPLVMDDIFVNFDPGRARRAMKEALTLTHEHQLLFFTCHPDTARWIQEIHPEADVRKLERKTLVS